MRQSGRKAKHGWQTKPFVSDKKTYLDGGDPPPQHTPFHVERQYLMKTNQPCPSETFWTFVFNRDFRFGANRGMSSNVVSKEKILFSYLVIKRATGQLVDLRVEKLRMQSEKSETLGGIVNSHDVLLQGG